MYRFFVPPSSIKGRRATLEGEVAHRVGRVLRMSPGDEIVLLDNSGDEYTVRLTGFTKDVVEGDVVSVDRASIETAIEITLYQGMVKGDKFQWVLQKGTELGVSNFVPLMCHRSIPKERASWRESRYPGWSKTVTEAAEQSRGACFLNCGRLWTSRTPVRKRRVLDYPLCHGSEKVPGACALRCRAQGQITSIYS